MRRCRCIAPTYQMLPDGRKPVRCAICRRRAFKRRPVERAKTWLALHAPGPIARLVIR